MSDAICAQKGQYVRNEQPGKKFRCACGRSVNQPYCDGSHHNTGFSPVPAAIEEAKNVAWCGCKQTGKRPYCDGTHKKLQQMLSINSWREDRTNNGEHGKVNYAISSDIAR
jgi:CDGSH iron-sulfur domain-containing protein 3